MNNSNNHIKRLKSEEHIVSYQADGFVIMAVFAVVFGLGLTMIGNLLSLSMLQIKDLVLFSPLISMIFTMYIMHNRIKYDAKENKN